LAQEKKPANFLPGSTRWQLRGLLAAQEKRQASFDVKPLGTYIAFERFPFNFPLLGHMYNCS
jgi:hypothetical protein